MKLLPLGVRERPHQLVDAPGVEHALTALRRRPRSSAAELERAGYRSRAPGAIYGAIGDPGTGPRSSFDFASPPATLRSGRPDRAARGVRHAS